MIIPSTVLPQVPGYGFGNRVTDSESGCGFENRVTDSVIGLRIRYPGYGCVYRVQYHRNRVIVNHVQSCDGRPSLPTSEFLRHDGRIVQRESCGCEHTWQPIYLMYTAARWLIISGSRISYLPPCKPQPIFLSVRFPSTNLVLLLYHIIGCLHYTEQDRTEPNRTEPNRSEGS